MSRAGSPDGASEHLSCSDWQARLNEKGGHRRLCLISDVQGGMMSILSVTRLSVGYGILRVLHDVSLVVEPGGVAVVPGPNPAGKSNLLAVLDEPTVGLAPRVVDRLAEAINATTGNGIAWLVAEQNLGWFADIATSVHLVNSGQDNRSVDMPLIRSLDKFRAAFSGTAG
jgi:ABC-type branched-subunit amino acid transport system ATPase component